MRPTAPPELEAIERWAALSRWERAEVGRPLRRLGWSYGEIRELIDVARATLSGFVPGHPPDRRPVAAIKDRGETRRGVPRDTRRRRRVEIECLQRDAREFAVAHLHDPLFVAGTVLYWGEGAKTSHPLTLSNADPAALGPSSHGSARSINQTQRSCCRCTCTKATNEELARVWRTSSPPSSQRRAVWALLCSRRVASSTG